MTDSTTTTGDDGFRRPRHDQAEARAKAGACRLADWGRDEMAGPTEERHGAGPRITGRTFEDYQVCKLPAKGLRREARS